MSTDAPGRMTRLYRPTFVQSKTKCKDEEGSIRAAKSEVANGSRSATIST
jgi:hypothetical protein